MCISINKNKVHNEIDEVLRMHHYEPGMRAINDLVDRWYDQKSDLIDLLSKHPLWEQDNLCIHFDTDSIREIDADEYRKLIIKMRNCVTNKSGVKDGYNDVFPVKMWKEYDLVLVKAPNGNEKFLNLSKYNSSEMEEKIKIEGWRLSEIFYNASCIHPVKTVSVEDLPTFFVEDEKLKSFFNDGQKLSRSLNAMFRAFGIDKIIDDYANRLNVYVHKHVDDYKANGYSNPHNWEESNVLTDDEFSDVEEAFYKEKDNNNKFVGVEGYDRLYGKLADILSPLVIKRHTMLSVHPADIFHMSYGNGWHSCHNIDDGCYMAGTLSYIGDECAMILYTLDKTFTSDGKYYLGHRINRQMYFYKDGCLIQSRLYPDYSDTTNSDILRAAVQKIIAECENVPNQWTLSRSNGTVLNHLHTHEESRHYPDYDYGQYNATISKLEGVFNGDTYKNMVIGSPCYCIECGSELDDTDFIDCCKDCHKHRCPECGEYYDEEDMYYNENDGEYYCSYCIETCSRCGETIFPGQDKYETENGDYVCEWCFERYYTTCSHCGCVINVEDGVFIGDDVYCTDCADEVGACCEDCGEYYLKDEMVLINGDWYCSDCAESHRAED